MKEVVFVTPVLYGSAHMPQMVHARTITYKRGSLLHQDEVPPICALLSPGMIIDLPEKNIQEYMRKNLQWLKLPNDDTLV